MLFHLILILDGLGSMLWNTFKDPGEVTIVSAGGTAAPGVDKTVRHA